MNYLLFVVIFATALPLWTWFSWIITAIHTIDEVFSDGGPVWEYLHRVSGVPTWLLAPAYAAFQLFVCWLAFKGIGNELQPAWTIAFVVVRLGDVGFTHGVLRSVRTPNPGVATAPLLLLDVAVVAALAM